MTGRRLWALAAGLLVVLACGALAACGSSNSDGGTSTRESSSASTTAAGASKGTITVGFIDNATGPLSFTSSKDAAQAAVDAANAGGGVNGYKIKMNVYDAQSNGAAGVAALRKALADGVLAVLGTSTYFDSAFNLLVKSGVPAFGPGASPGWFSNSKLLFPFIGDAFHASTTAWVKGCTDNGRKKVALAVGTFPGAEQLIPVKEQLVQVEGGTVSLKRVGIDSAIASQVTSLAQQIKDSGAQCVAASIHPGGPQLQVALNQIGADASVIDAGAYGPAVEEQFGKSADGLLFANSFAPLTDTSNPGVRRYLADMKAYAPHEESLCECVMGYATVKVFLHSLEQVQGQPTSAKVAEVANRIDGYDIDGLIAPVHFPQFHSHSGRCLGYSELKDGKWIALRGDGPHGFVCGQEVRVGQ